MDLSKLFKERLEKIENIKNFISLNGRKKEYFKELKDLSVEISAVNDLMSNSKNAMENFQKSNKINCLKTIERAQKQQICMLNILELLEERTENENKVKNIESSTEPFATQNLNILKEQNTPAKIIFKVSYGSDNRSDLSWLIFKMHLFVVAK